MAKMEKLPQGKPKNRRNKLIFVFLALVVVLAGIGFLGKAILLRLTSGVVSIDKNGGLTIQGSQGDFSFQEGGSLPKNFPSDFPGYPGAKLTGSWTAEGNTKEGISVVWETSDAAKKVQGFYKDQLPKSGWKITDSFDTDNSSTISFEKKGMGGFLGITESDGVTTISVTVGTKQ